MASSRALALLLTGTLAATALLPLAAAAGEQPRWTVGDYWHYTGTVQVPFLGDRTLQRTITVAARESVVVQGVGQDAWRLTINDLTNLGGGAVTNLTTTEWYRPSDLSLLKSHTDLLDVTTVYTPPPNRYQFPLLLGETWIVIATTEVSGPFGNRTDSVAFDSRITDTQDVTATGAGTSRTFSAVILREDDAIGSGYTLNHYAEDAGWWVKVEHRASANRVTMTLSLDRFRYAPPPTPLEIGGFVALLAFVLVMVAILVLVARRPRQRGGPPNPYAAPPQQPPAGPGP